jgi:predicted permease
VLFPCLLLESVAKAELGDLEILPMAGAILCAMAVMTALMLMLRPWLGVDGPAFTSMYQGVIRMNTYLAFAVAAGVGGKPAVEATAVSVAIFVPAANLLCVTVLVRYAGGDSEGSLRRTVVAVAKNPLILSILGGILLNVTGIGVPPVIGPMLSILGNAALGLGLISVGAGLDFVHARASGRTVLLTTVLKLTVMPALGYGFCLLFDVDGVACFAVVLLNAMPTAGAAYILARQMGGDASLVASIITVETALSMATLPVVLALTA